MTAHVARGTAGEVLRLTQALLALRGEMGEAYVTIPDPFRSGQTLMLRFQQENLPKYQTAMTSAGPRVHVKLSFEGEALSGAEDYRDPEVLHAVEESARRHMDAQMRQVIAKLLKWQADPVGFGLLFRKHFATWSEWDRYNWPDRMGSLQVEVETKMRIRRHGLILGAEQELEE